ncbi:tRNA modification GTPase MnmE [Candidatus Rhabdochlamydia porcellionis]|jgi:tRNA modification GTPase|uniref:tRNA modification GTPase MnmE n=2 Tax=Candidatus Rhabdochlamydia porcellionis TaxID=225148 RepID=A0ABX8Z1P5_9BACT|nr:tRNA modification GTPase MnmE [Candidatus Rhabdochlamydia porcellionis]
MYTYHQMDQTIAAIATAPGEGGVAVIRVAGKQSIEIVAKVFSGPIHSYSSHTAHLGKIVNIDRVIIDEVLALVMRAPKSYTGEDVVEIHCHGGSLISRRVLETILEAGARAAGPGEFTFRAFIHGKIDLVQAEAVQNLIAAKNDLALHAAEQQLQGQLSSRIFFFQKQLVDIAAMLEAWVDFPEEDLEFASIENVITQLENLRKQICYLAATFQEGKLLQFGPTLCLIGPPNAGKSSLMNVLLGKERAIVTSIAGTTRDTLEEELLIGNLHFRLIDTAGIRETKEIIEQEGIRRSKEAMQKADLVLLLLDASLPLCPHANQLLSIVDAKKTLLVWNKSDIASILPDRENSLLISAKNQTGIEALKQKISQMIWQKAPPSKEEVLITNIRHEKNLLNAAISLKRVIDGLHTNVSPEFLSFDLKICLQELGEIIGHDITEDILTAIFSKFCVGK